MYYLIMVSLQPNLFKCYQMVLFYIIIIHYGILCSEKSYVTPEFMYHMTQMAKELY